MMLWGMSTLYLKQTGSNGSETGTGEATMAWHSIEATTTYTGNGDNGTY
jgi:hypothetical protein